MNHNNPDKIILKAYHWIGPHCFDGAFIKHGWRDVITLFSPERQLLWAKLLYRLDAPDNLHGLRTVLHCIKWMIDDLDPVLDTNLKHEFKDIHYEINLIQTFYERSSSEKYALYDTTDFYGILTKHPMYSLFMSASGDQTQFTEFALFPIAWLLVFLDHPINHGARLYNINKQLRKITAERSLTVMGIDEFSGHSIIDDSLNEILTDRKKPSQYIQFLEDLGLKSALKIIRQIEPETHQRTNKTFGGKVFGATVIGRNNQVSATQGNFKNIPTHGYSEDLGHFELKGFINHNLINRKEPSLKIIEPQDHILTNMIEVPISGITRTRPRRNTKTANLESELDTTKRKVNAKFLGDATIRANQHLITNTSILDQYTLEVLIIELQNLLSEKFELQNTRQGIHPTIAVAVMATCLFYGKPLQYAITSVRKRTLKNTGDGYYISLTQNNISGHWLLETPLAGLVKNNTVFCHTEDVEGFYRLPIPLWLTKVLLETETVKKQYIEMDLIEENRDKTLKNLGFVWTETDFKKAYDRFFNQIKKKHPGIELNLNLVEHYLQNASLHDYDVIFSAYFTGKRTLFSHTQLFYTRLEEKLIYSKFAEFWDARFYTISINNPELTSLNQWSGLKESHYIGSALVPRKNIVKKIAKDLLRQLEKHPTQSLADTVRYHQIFTIYTMVFLSYATGYRGVHDLLPNWRLINEDYIWLAISDKDDQDASHTRLTFLAPLIREQLQHYLSHLKALLAKILLLNFSLYEKLINELRDWQLRLNYRTIQERFLFDDATKGVFFGIDLDKGEIAQMSLNYFFDHLKKEQHIELPANGGRHLIRTEALKMSVSSDVLDAFLGHFIYGKEPHSIYSALAITEIETGMEDFLQQHLKSLGFKPIKSLLLR